jgi:hypothetical protein
MTGWLPVDVGYPDPGMAALWAGSYVGAMTAPAHLEVRMRAFASALLVALFASGCSGASNAASTNSGAASTNGGPVSTTSGAPSTGVVADKFANGGWCKADTLRDSGRAPDITTVCVGSSPDGTIELRVRTAAPITSRDQLAFSIDADLNRQTGSPAGFDYWVGSIEGRVAALQAPNGDVLHLATLHGFVRNRDLILIINRSDLGDSTGFRFYAWSQRAQVYGDDAPNGGAVRKYVLPRA